MRVHCNASTNRKQRLMIQAEYKQGRSLRSLARQLCVCVATAHRWSRRTTPEDASSRPKRSRYAFTADEQQAILALRKDKQLALDDLLNAIEEVMPQVNACRSSVHRLLVRHGMGRLQEGKLTDKEPAGTFKDYAPGFIHMDCTYLPRVGDAKRRYGFVAVDRATRLMHLAVYETKSMQSSTDFLRQCASRFPFAISKLLTDNGLEFCAPPIKKRGNLAVHPFEALCKEFGIEHRRTRPYTPKTNGLAERMNATIKADTVRSHVYATAQEMLDALAAYPKHFNYERRSKVLGRITPLQAAQRWQTKQPELFHVSPDHMLSIYCSQPAGT